jgi:hypothetical protein
MGAASAETVADSARTAPNAVDIKAFNMTVFLGFFLVFKNRAIRPETACSRR